MKKFHWDWPGYRDNWVPNPKYVWRGGARPKGRPKIQRSWKADRSSWKGPRKVSGKVTEWSQRGEGVGWEVGPEAGGREAVC